MPALLPNQLTVNCASAQNFKLFRQYSDYIGLTGVVSMVDTRLGTGRYWAGGLYLFPWLKPLGLAQRHLSLPVSLPTGNSSSRPAAPIAGASLPQDEYLCRVLLQVPWQNFIGFQIDTPPGTVDFGSVWSSTIPKLADGKPVWINWTSANLNKRWFGGSNVIPDQSTCNGSAWRGLIANAVNRASAGVC